MKGVIRELAVPIRTRFLFMGHLFPPHSFLRACMLEVTWFRVTCPCPCPCMAHGHMSMAPTPIPTFTFLLTSRRPKCERGMKLAVPMRTRFLFMGHLFPSYSFLHSCMLEVTWFQVTYVVMCSSPHKLF